MLHKQCFSAAPAQAPARANSFTQWRRSVIAPQVNNRHSLSSRLHAARSPKSPSSTGWASRMHRPAAILCRSTLLPDPIPEDVQLELDPDAAAKEVTYDEDSKTVRIPLAAVNGGQRRTKMVMFTCNQCGGRSARLVNPVAWEKGAVFCQCQHCEVWHTLAANKTIIEEIRYNDPDWQLPQAQTAEAATAGAGEDGAASGSSAQSSGTVLGLGQSEAGQEVTSAAAAASGQEQQQERQ